MNQYKDSANELNKRINDYKNRQQKTAEEIKDLDKIQKRYVYRKNIFLKRYYQYKEDLETLRNGLGKKQNTKNKLKKVWQKILVIVAVVLFSLGLSLSLPIIVFALKITGLGILISAIVSGVYYLKEMYPFYKVKNKYGSEKELISNMKEAKLISMSSQKIVSSLKRQKLRKQKTLEKIDLVIVLIRNIINNLEEINADIDMDLTSELASINEESLSELAFTHYAKINDELRLLKKKEDGK